MKPKVKIICTIGPSSFNEGVLKRFETRGVSIVRINLSHVDLEEIEDFIVFLKKFNTPIAIDTEGSQIRTGYIDHGSVTFHSNDIIKIHNSEICSDSGNIYFTPYNVVDFFKPGDLIALDFNSVLLRVEDVSPLSSEGFIKCRVIIEGSIGSRKGVYCDSITSILPTFSKKDLHAIELSKRYGIVHFTLSFINSAEEVKEFKCLYPKAVAYAKIETLEGLKNVESIMKHADGILVDRGDLSREIPVEKIPLVQKYLIGKANLANKEVFIASNLLETMATELKPSRAEVNDVVNTIIDGVSGFVLTKETAVGRYPVETVNMMNNLIQQGKGAQPQSLKVNNSFIRFTGPSPAKDIDYLIDRDTHGFLIEPHGGKLVNLFLDGTIYEDLTHLPRLSVSEDILMDLEQIGIGTFSPLEGFLNRSDYQGVLKNMRLTNGVPWSIPIILPVNKEEKYRLKIGEEIAIGAKDDNSVYGVLELEEMYPFDKDEFAQEIYLTTDSKHPGVQNLKTCGNYLLGGKIKLLRRNHTNFSRVSLTPRQVRNIFESLGWSKIVGFHTRNVIHRSHEFIQLQAMERCGCDGLFIHPVVGKKKKGDYTAEAIIQSYEIMIEKYYPRNRVVFGVFSTYSRYAGPREAIFTALCRKNFGCSHFVVGRDHTGVGNFYDPIASQKIFNQFKDLGIEPVFFGEIGYSKELKRYTSREECGSEDLLNISGTEARKMFTQKMLPPEWFMHPEISQLILNKLSNGEEVFIS